MSSPVIRAANDSDAAALARLRYEFRSSIDAAVEPEAAFCLYLRHGFAVRDGLLERRMWQSSFQRHAT